MCNYYNYREKRLAKETHPDSGAQDQGKKHFVPEPKTKETCPNSEISAKETYFAPKFRAWP